MLNLVPFEAMTSPCGKQVPHPSGAETATVTIGRELEVLISKDYIGSEAELTKVLAAVPTVRGTTTLAKRKEPALHGSGKVGGELEEAGNHVEWVLFVGDSGIVRNFNIG